MAKLQGGAWQGMRTSDKLDSLDDVEEDSMTKLPKGVSQLLQCLRDKNGILEVECAGKYMRMFMKETRWKPTTPRRDFLTPLE
eukprot:6853804-Pyramimonas_sp.AAC.1